MALFGRGKEEKVEDDPAEAGTEAPEDEVADEATEASTDGEGPAPTDEAQDSGPQQGEDEPKKPSIDVEDSLKDLSARMAMLSSNLDGVKESKGSLEDKLGSMEQRIARLGSLAEAVSSQYNPFIQENAPSEPSWHGKEDPSEVPEAPQGSPPVEEASGEPGANGEGQEDEEQATAEQDAAAEMDQVPAPQPEPEPEPLPKAAEFPGPDTFQDGEATTEAEAEADTPDPVEQALAPFAPSQRETDAFEDNLLMLEWVGLMLRRVGRAGLLDLLDYYQGLGWLDATLKDRATRIAVGVEAPDRVGDGHWRGDLELHRRSLVALQRLHGNEVPTARMDELALDLRRLFGDG